MKQIPLSINIKSPFGNLHRERTVLIVIKNSQGKYLLGAKEGHYPDGISRLMGGGVDNGEDILSAAIRELKEELNVTIPLEQLEPYADVLVEAIDEKGVKYSTCISIVKLTVPIDQYSAGDDVTNVVELTKEEVLDLIKRYQELSPDFWFENDQKRFNWADYGKVYAPVHKIAIE